MGHGPLACARHYVDDIGAGACTGGAHRAAATVLAPGGFIGHRSSSRDAIDNHRALSPYSNVTVSVSWHVSQTACNDSYSTRVTISALALACPSGFCGIGTVGDRERWEGARSVGVGPGI